MQQRFQEFQQRNDYELQKRSEELYKMSNDFQRQMFHNEVDSLLKGQYDNQGAKPSPKDIVILNTGLVQDYNWYAQQNSLPGQQNPNAAASLFNDSKFVPFDQHLQDQNSQGNEDPKAQTAKFTYQALPSASMQLGLDNFKVSNPLVSLPSQSLYPPGPQSLSQQQLQSVGNPQIIQSQLIQQYEQVLQLMHQEIQKLILQNQELQDQQQKSQGTASALQSQRIFNDQQSLQQMQMLMKEKDELIETLRQREHVIMQLRMEIDTLNSNMIEIQSKFESQASQQTAFKVNSEAQLKAKNEHMLERLKKLEKQVREMEQQNFEFEQMNKNLKRDLKHQSIINEQMQQEQIEINQKRDALDQMLQEAKNKLCQSMIQTRQLNGIIEQQQIEITNLANQRNQYEKLAEQTNLEGEHLRDQLNEAEGIKLGQFQIIERKEREIQNLRVMCRRFITVVQTHREEFGDLADVNYDNLFKDVSNTNLNFQLPQSQFQHLQKITKQVKFDIELGQPIKNKGRENQAFRGAQQNDDDDYYGMVEKLTQYVRENNSHHNSMAQSYAAKQRSPGRGQDLKPILKQAFHDDAPAEQPTSQGISWVSGVQNQQPSQQQQQPTLSNRAIAKGKSPERVERKPNVEGLRTTLAALMEEKKNLENQLRTGQSAKMTEDLKFDLEVNSSNIKRVQEKLASAGAL